ncbi:MAG TPA: energy transducer TonB [Gemmatimonadales bacterium]
MFDRIYGRRSSHPTGSIILSVGVHAVAITALSVGTGVVVSTATQQVAEGLTYLAPPPAASAAPRMAAEQITFAGLPGLGGDASELGRDGFAELPIPGTGASPGGRIDGSDGLPSLDLAAVDLTRNADSVYLSSQVDNPVAYDARSAAPAYPDSLRLAGVEGVVEAQFVVDTTGRVELASFVLLESTHRGFTQSVRAALPGMLFRPAQLNGRKIKQLVQLPFVFRIEPAATADTTDSDTARRDTTEIRD